MFCLDIAGQPKNLIFVIINIVFSFTASYFYSSFPNETHRAAGSLVKFRVPAEFHLNSSETVFGVATATHPFFIEILLTVTGRWEFRKICPQVIF